MSGVSAPTKSGGNNDLTRAGVQKFNNFLNQDRLMAIG